MEKRKVRWMSLIGGIGGLYVCMNVHVCVRVWWGATFIIRRTDVNINDSCVCVRVCVCHSVYTWYPITPARPYTYAHTHANAHQPLTHPHTPSPLPPSALLRHVRTHTFRHSQNVLILELLRRTLCCVCEWVCLCVYACWTKLWVQKGGYYSPPLPPTHTHLGQK